jgi:hypothetical protein
MAQTNGSGPVDLLSASSVLAGTPAASPHAHAYQVGVASLACANCEGCGEVGVSARTHEGVDSARCPACDGTGTTLDDERISEILAAAVKAEDIELAVECEAALVPVQREYTRRAHVARVAELVAARRAA